MHDAIDVGFCRERLEVRSVAGEARGDGARAQDQRADPRQRRRDRVGQAEGEEIGFGIGPQHAERQDDESRQRLRQRRRGAAVHARDGAKLLRHRLRRCRPLVGPLGERATDHAVHRGDGRGARQRRWLLVARRVEDFDDRPAAERRPAREHLEEDRARGEQIAARVDGLAGHLLGRHVARCAQHDPRCGSVRSSASSERPDRRAARGRSRAASRRVT